MPLLEKRQGVGFTLIVWESTEDIDFFKNQVSFYSSELDYYNRITHKNRLREWLTVRYILQNILNYKTPIAYDENRRPTIPEKHMGISHSGTMVCVIVADFPCSVDIEEVSPRVSKIAHKAFTATELELANTHEKLTVYWGVKEAVYKLYGKGNVDFKTHMHVCPIVDFNSGVIKCHFLKKNVLLEHLNLETIGHYKLVWIVDKNNSCHGF